MALRCIGSGADEPAAWSTPILVHHSVILEFDVPSYRTASAKQKRATKTQTKVKPAKAQARA